MIGTQTILLMGSPSSTKRRSSLTLLLYCSLRLVNALPPIPSHTWNTVFGNLPSSRNFSVKRKSSSLNNRSCPSGLPDFSQTRIDPDLQSPPLKIIVRKNDLRISDRDW